MNRLTVVLLLLALAALACTFSTSSNRSSEPDVTPVPTQIGAVPTATPFATQTPTTTPQPTSAPVATATAIVVVDPCTPRTDWPLYSVVAGDTLARIARRVNSTASALADANCLDNPNLLRVGQALRVPQLPPPPTETPIQVPPPPVFYYPPAPDSFHTVNDIGVVTSANVHLTVGVDRAQFVRFFVRSFGSGVTSLAGEDHYLADGADTYYTFPSAGRYDLFAVAGNGFNEVQSGIFKLTYNPDFVEPPVQGNGAPLVQPYLAYEGHYTLEAGRTVNLSWPDAPENATSIDFLLTPTGTGTADAEQVIATDYQPTDGQGATWQVPGGIWAHLHAEAHLPDGRTVNSQIVNVYAERQ